MTRKERNRKKRKLEKQLVETRRIKRAKEMREEYWKTKDIPNGTLIIDKETGKVGQYYKPNRDDSFDSLRYIHDMVARDIGKDLGKLVGEVNNEATQREAVDIVTERLLGYLEGGIKRDG